MGAPGHLRPAALTSRSSVISHRPAAAERLRQAPIPGDVIVWADVLHEGPVPATNDAREFRETCARYLGDQHYGDFATILTRDSNTETPRSRHSASTRSSSSGSSTTSSISC